MTEEEIIEANLALGEVKMPIMEMLDKQEGLIRKFMKFGHTQEDFYRKSRELSVKTGKISLVGNVCQIIK